MEVNVVKPLDTLGQLCLWPQMGWSCRTKVESIAAIKRRVVPGETHVDHP
jgi:hypothetical protein